MTNKLIKYWLPVFVWAIVIFLFSNRPAIHTIDFYLADFLIKKTAHIMEYGILATLIFRALINSNFKKKQAMFLSVLFAFLYGITDEFHQSFIPGREPTIRDVLIDTTGASIFVFGIIERIK